MTVALMPALHRQSTRVHAKVQFLISSGRAQKWFNQKTVICFHWKSIYLRNPAQILFRSYLQSIDTWRRKVYRAFAEHARNRKFGLANHPLVQNRNSKYYSVNKRELLGFAIQGFFSYVYQSIGPYFFYKHSHLWSSQIIDRKKMFVSSTWYNFFVSRK